MVFTRVVALVLLSLFSTRLTNGLLRSSLDNIPVNTAALVGTESVLNCSATLTGTDFLTWDALNGTTLAYNRIYSSLTNAIAPGYTGMYEIDSSAADGQYNLIILDTNAAVATRYECTLIVNNTKRDASVVAVEELQCPESGMEVVAGTETLALCQVVYHSAVSSSILTPTLTWSAAEGNDAVIQEVGLVGNTTYVGMAMNVTLNAENDEQNFTCELSFQGVGAPTYTASCETFFYVLYGVSDISIEPNITEGEELPVGTVITCTANGRPAPTILWVDVDGNTTLSENDTLTVDETMVDQGSVTFICQATNEVENDTYVVEKNITFVAGSKSASPETADESQPGPAPQLSSEPSNDLHHHGHHKLSPTHQHKFSRNPLHNRHTNDNLSHDHRRAFRRHRPPLTLSPMPTPSSGCPERGDRSSSRANCRGSPSLRRPRVDIPSRRGQPVYHRDVVAKPRNTGISRSDVRQNSYTGSVNVNIQPVSSGGVETWVIVVAVVVPVVVLAAAGVAGFFVYRHHQKKKASKSKQYNANGNGTATATAATSAAANRDSDPVENQPFLYSTTGPQPAARSTIGDVSYQANGQPRPGSTMGFADLGSAAPNGSGPVGGSTSRIASPAPMSYPYNGPASNVSLIGAGPGSVMGSQRGMPAITAGAPASTYAASTGRMTPANVSMQQNPVTYPYATVPSRQMSNASSASRGSSYQSGSQRMQQPPPLSYPPARSVASSHNSSLV